ncbi:MAG TPA: RNA polymerase sigma factor [Candidatus Dormibacteraeota bacterium]|nr:RNA polymerase sigma factor [Candidatus Dormibacteraeota bacterium]
MIDGSALDLVDRARAGDKRAFEELLQPLIAPAARFAFGMVQDREEAEDVVQDAGLKAWRRLGNLREGAPFGPWFFGIVANQCRTSLRSRWRSELRFGELFGGDPVSAEAEFLHGADLRQALKGLPRDQRAAILLHFYLDQPLDQVAVSLGISLAGVKSRINRGLRRLRLALPASEEA